MPGMAEWMTGWRSLILGFAIGAAVFLLLLVAVFLPAFERSEDKAEDCVETVLAGGNC
jgi:hypothetical protein